MHKYNSQQALMSQFLVLLLFRIFDTHGLGPRPPIAYWEVGPIWSTYGDSHPCARLQPGPAKYQDYPIRPVGELQLAISLKFIAPGFIKTHYRSCTVIQLCILELHDKHIRYSQTTCGSNQANQQVNTLNCGSMFRALGQGHTHNFGEMCVAGGWLVHPCIAQGGPVS